MYSNFAVNKIVLVFKHFKISWYYSYDFYNNIYLSSVKKAFSRAEIHVV